MTDEISVDDAAGGDAPATFAGRHPVIVYSGLRLALLVGVGLLLYLAGARGVLLIILAFLISGLISVLVLVPQRDRVGQRLGGYFRRLNDRIEESKRSEDDLVDAFRTDDGSANTRHSASIVTSNDPDRQQ